MALVGVDSEQLIPEQSSDRGMGVIRPIRLLLRPRPTTRPSFWLELPPGEYVYGRVWLGARLRLPTVPCPCGLVPYPGGV